MCRDWKKDKLKNKQEFGKSFDLLTVALNSCTSHPIQIIGSNNLSITVITRNSPQFINCGHWKQKNIVNQNDKV